MRRISICIPTYEMQGCGREFLNQGLDSLATQTFRDFDVVVSHHSRNDDIQRLCSEYQGRLEIHYFHNAEKLGSSSANLNNAIRKATGSLIKILFQDDYLYDRKSLQQIVDHFDLEKDRWMVTACEHTEDGTTLLRPFYPRYNDRIHLGNNTISSPSVLTIRNDDPLLFDERLVWLMDVDYYKRCFDAFGQPKVLDRVTVVNRIGKHQVSSAVVTQRIRKNELRYVRRKYGEGPTIRQRFHSFLVRVLANQR